MKQLPLKLFCGIVSVLCLCSASQIFAQSLAIDSLSGAITQNEIDSFKSYMLTQVPPPTPWGALNGTGHNAWCDGAGGNNLEAFGLMYEATGDIGILTNMIFWTDTAVSERNDLMSAANGGQRVCWDGIIDHIWVAQDLAATNPGTGCETGDAQGHITFTAKLILENPSLWNTTVPDGDPFGYGTTYLDRAKTYIGKCDDANSQYVLKYFIQSGTDLIRDPTNAGWSGLSTPNNRQSMFYVGFKRLAECHEILGDNPGLVTQYDAIVQAASGECINGMAGYHPTTVNGDTVYDWGYYPFDVYNAHTENVGHGAYDIYGVYNAYTRSVYGYSLSTVKPFANALLDVMNIATNSFSGIVDGTGTAQNYMQQQWLLLADMRASVYDVVAQAGLVSTRYRTNPYLTAAILWMKNRRLLEFSVAATPSSQAVVVGSGTTYNVSLSPLAGFTGTVNLSVSGLPSGATASFNQGSVNFSTISSFFTNVTLSVSTASSTPAGTYTLTITGTSGTVTNSASVSLVVSDFTVSATPSSQTVQVGNSTSYTVNLGNLNGFVGTISLSSSGLPTGAGASFNPTSLTAPGSSTMTVTTSGSTPAANSTLTIKGTSGSLVRSANVTLQATDFSPSITPASETVTAGSSTTYTLTVSALNGFNGTVTFGSVSGLPSGAGASFNPTSVTGSGSSTLTITTSTSTPAGTYTLTVPSNSGGQTHNVTVTLQVTDFSLSASPGSLTITQGNNGTSTITVNPINGFGDSVALTASGLPSGVTASFNPSSTTSTSTLTLSASSTATTGTATVTVTGTDGTLTHTTTISLTVQAPGGPLPLGWTDADVGAVGIAGSASYNSGTYTVSGSGADISGAGDQFNYAYQSVSGDVTVIARVVSENGVQQYAKAGVMIRESLATNAAQASMLISPTSGVAMEIRTADGGSGFNYSGWITGVLPPQWVKMVRSGNTFTGYYSADGNTWTEAGSTNITMATNVNVGLAVSAHSDANMNTATFDNVSVTAFAGVFQLQNEASGLVLNNQGSLTNGSPITQWTSVTSSNLEWTFIATSNGYYQINSYRSGKDAVVQGAATTNGAGIVQWSFGSSGDDQWKPVQNSDGSYTFYNLKSGLVLEDPASSTNKTTQMDQWTANGGANQKWNLLKQ